jgi:hypothetical protein
MIYCIIILHPVLSTLRTEQLQSFPQNILPRYRGERFKRDIRSEYQGDGIR